MNVERLATSPIQYGEWELNHPNSSESMKDYASNVSKSQEFQNWLSSNPKGTLEQYLLILERQNKVYYNSPQYQITQLNYEVQEKDLKIEQLNKQIEELNTEVSDVNNENHNLHAQIIFFAILAFFFICVSVALGYRLKKAITEVSFRKIQRADKNTEREVAE